MLPSDASPAEPPPLFSPGLRDMLLAAFFFSVMSLMVKLASRLTSLELVMGRTVVSLVITWAMLRQAKVSPWGHRKGLLALRGLAGFVALLCFFFAISRLPLAEVTVIQFTNPVFVALLAGLFLQESLSGREQMSLALSLLGVVFIAKPTFLFGASLAQLDLLAVGVALVGALLAAIAYTTIRKLRETEDRLVVIWYLPLVSAVVGFPMLLPILRWPTLTEALLILGIGITTQIAQVFLTRGLHTEKAARGTSMSYVQILFATLWGFLFFQELPDAWSLLGTLLVVGGTFIMAWGANR